MDYDILPLGLGMALAQDLDAMEAFVRLPEEEKRAFIDAAHSVRSHDEMQEHVRSLLV